MLTKNMDSHDNAVLVELLRNTAEAIEEKKFKTVKANARKISRILKINDEKNPRGISITNQWISTAFII